MVNKKLLGAAVLAALLIGMVGVSNAQFAAKDPGVRGGAAGAGQMLQGLNAQQRALFTDGQADFAEAEGVGDGLGPRFNLDSCGGCHAAPAVGGSSPAVNPQVALATAFGARNTVPSFIRRNGPVREVRFVKNPDGSPDGGVHALFVISGRVDSTGNASGCNIKQDDFATQFANNNAIFRIPTPTFGLGLIEAIPDKTLVANQAAAAPQKAQFGIGGRFNTRSTSSSSSTSSSVSGEMNRSGNDGTITRFGWKAQNKSLLVFSGEAYNVEMGITNDAFQNERDETASCQFATVPNDPQPDDGTIGAIEKFAVFMRFLAAPTPSTNSPGGSTSINNGKQVFSQVGCNLCHTPTLTTGNAYTPALANKSVNLFSDLMLHGMGPGLADGISQGAAAGDEFRTAPLWGLGQRIFFLHDGRTSDLVEAIQQHRSAGNATYSASEANGVINNYNGLRESDKQDLLNFLRSL